ncbi:MAG: ctpA [Patescibacteria group bacterium]|jgi:carboxyl-terminal processing protease|nr:ctpA [Patescibacteria group bacterium]
MSISQRNSTFGRRVLLLALVCLMVLGSLALGFYVGRYNQVITSSIPSYITSPFGANNDHKKTDLSLFWQAWNAIDQKYYGQIDDAKRIDGAIAGMVASLEDPYTVYMEPSASESFLSDLEGEFSGIGAELNVKDGQLVIVAALEGTPAEKAGLKGQDVILEVDGKKTSEMSFDDAISSIRGPKGTEVELTIARQGAESSLKVKISRDTIIVKSVKSSVIGQNESISYIKVNQFGEDTAQLLQDALADAVSSGKKGAILDLRNNPGGYLDTAIQAIGMVLPKNPQSENAVLRNRTAVIERFKDGSEQSHKSQNDPVAASLPIAVLVNGGSASASEIFAGAMKDYGRAKVIGTKTFGKGSVQELQKLNNEGSVKVTIAKWFTPAGTGIDGIGVEPDVVVEVPAETELGTTDPQAQKALELLQQ